MENIMNDNWLEKLIENKIEEELFNPDKLIDEWNILKENDDKLSNLKLKFHRFISYKLLSKYDKDLPSIYLNIAQIPMIILQDEDLDKLLEEIIPLLKNNHLIEGEQLLDKYKIKGTEIKSFSDLELLTEHYPIFKKYVEAYESKNWEKCKQYGEILINNSFKFIPGDIEKVPIELWVGMSCYYMNKYKEAKNHLEKSLSVNKDHYLAYKILGDIYYSNYEYDKSYENYLSFLDNEPKHIYVLIKIVQILLINQNWKNLLKYSKRMVSILEESNQDYNIIFVYYLYQSIAYHNLKKYEKSSHIFGFIYPEKITNLKFREFYDEWNYVIAIRALDNDEKERRKVNVIKNELLDKIGSMKGELSVLIKSEGEESRSTTVKEAEKTRSTTVKEGEKTRKILYSLVEQIKNIQVGVDNILSPEEYEKIIQSILEISKKTFKKSDISGRDEIKNYLESEMKQVYNNLSKDSKTFLETGEYLRKQLEEFDDFSMSIVSFAKVVENELHERIIVNLKNYAIKNGKIIESISKNSTNVYYEPGMKKGDYDYKFDIITLGGYKYLLEKNNYNVQKFLDEQYKSDKNKIIRKLLPRINKTLILRNSCAHRSKADRKRVGEIRKLLIQDGFLEEIIAL